MGRMTAKTNAFLRFDKRVFCLAFTHSLLLDLDMKHKQQRALTKETVLLHSAAINKIATVTSVEDGPTDDDVFNVLIKKDPRTVGGRLFGRC